MAYVLTKADVLEVAGELALLDETRWATALTFAKARCSNSDAFGGDANAKIAATYLAAHLAKLRESPPHSCSRSQSPIASAGISLVQLRRECSWLAT